MGSSVFFFFFAMWIRVPGHMKAAVVFGNISGSQHSGKGSAIRAGRERGRDLWSKGGMSFVVFLCVV
jgi:hypothetical protein